jgi:hypothetical protein
MSGYLSDVVKPQTEEVPHNRTASEMIRAMELKNLFSHTRRAYLTAVTGLA